MTPLHLQILLHYHVSPLEYAHDNARHRDSTSVIQFHEELKVERLLERPDQPNEYGARFRITDRGRAFVEALCRVNLPQQAWVVPAGFQRS